MKPLEKETRKGGYEEPDEFIEVEGGEEDMKLANEEAEEDPLEAEVQEAEPEELEGGEVAAEGVPKDGEDQVEEGIEPVIVFKVATPMESKSEKCVLEVLNLWVIQLRTHGYEIRRFHSDRGGEFFGRKIKKWAQVSGIFKSCTARDTQANGRAKKARYVHAKEMMRLSHRPKEILQFGERLLLKKCMGKRTNLSLPTKKSATLASFLRVMGVRW